MSILSVVEVLGRIKDKGHRYPGESGQGRPSQRVHVNRNVKEIRKQAMEITEERGLRAVGKSYAEAHRHESL